MKLFLLSVLLWLPGLKGSPTYIPSWENLDQRPLPEWYDRAKVGIYVHWGVYSVPAFGNTYAEWFWKSWKDGKMDYMNFINTNFPKGFKYENFALGFKAEYFNPTEWADLFAKSGAKYVVLTSKHLDGYALFNSEQSKNWNSVALQPHRDIVKDLGLAARSKGLKFGISYSLIEWFNQLYLDDMDSKQLYTSYVDKKITPELTSLVQAYEPSIIWVDNAWSARSTYFKSKTFLTWLYNDSPVKNVVVVNDRWGNDTMCTHGGFFTCKDNYNPRVIQDHKFENVFSLDRQSWGFRRNTKLREVLSMKEIIDQLVTTVSCGGNVLINVGATKEGTIVPIFQERLLGLGDWLKLNGQGIYSSSPWMHQTDSRNFDVWYTCYRDPYDSQRPTRLPLVSDEITAIFAIVLKWPEHDTLILKDILPYVNKYNQTTILGESLTLTLESHVNDGLFYVKLPSRYTLRSDHAWTVKFTRS